MSRALTNVPGVHTVAVDLVKRTVRISYDPEKVSLDVLKGEITDSGYDIEA